MFNIISFSQKLIKGGGVGIRAGGGWKIFQKLISGGGTIIRYSRVQAQYVFQADLFKGKHHKRFMTDINMLSLQ